MCLRTRKGTDSNLKSCQGRLNPADTHLASLHEVVFPHSHDAPTSLSQGLIHSTIPGLVCGELLSPEGAIVDWQVGMLWTAVPKAAVHEYSQLELWKCEVRSPEDVVVASPAGDFVLAQQPSQGDFSFLVAAPANAGHDLRTFGPGKDIGHVQSSWLKKPNIGCSGVPTSKARSRRRLPSSHEVSGSRQHPWQAARLELSEPCPLLSMHTGSEEHH